MQIWVWDAKKKTYNRHYKFWLLIKIVTSSK